VAPGKVPIAPPAGRVELGDALMPSSQIGYQRVICESRESWGGLFFPIWHKGDQARGKTAARGMRLRALFPHPFRGGLTSAAPTALIGVSESWLLAGGRVILTKNGIAVEAGWALGVRFGLGRRLKPTLLKERCRD